MVEEAEDGHGDDEKMI